MAHLHELRPFAFAFELNLDPSDSLDLDSLLRGGGSDSGHTHRVSSIHFLQFHPSGRWTSNFVCETGSTLWFDDCDVDALQFGVFVAFTFYTDLLFAAVDPPARPAFTEI